MPVVRRKMIREAVLGAAASGCLLERMSHLLSRAEPRALVQPLAIGRLCYRGGKEGLEGMLLMRAGLWP